MEASYEELFILKEVGGWDFYQAYNLPLALRRWWLERLLRHKEEEKEHAEKEAKKAKGSKSPATKSRAARSPIRRKFQR